VTDFKLPSGTCLELDTTPMVQYGEPAVGDTVVIVYGKLHGARGTVTAVIDAETPSGSPLRLAVVRGPRGGERRMFLSQVRLVEP
jgi:hypothetical protein